jgi:hypothetical protein
LSQFNDVGLYPYSLGIGDPSIQFRVADIVSVIGLLFGMTAGKMLAVWTTGYVASALQELVNSFVTIDPH